MIHILPINDSDLHEQTTTCKCNPKVEWEDPATGEVYRQALVIHNAFDCREAAEEAQRILDEC